MLVLSRYDMCVRLLFLILLTVGDKRLFHLPVAESTEFSFWLFIVINKETNSARVFVCGCVETRLRMSYYLSVKLKRRKWEGKASTYAVSLQSLYPLIYIARHVCLSLQNVVRFRAFFCVSTYLVGDVIIMENKRKKKLKFYVKERS